MAKYYCKWCGASYPNINALTVGPCSRNPYGKKHELYEGSEKSKYTCKYCGASYPNISALTVGPCRNSPHKTHSPAL